MQRKSRIGEVMRPGRWKQIAGSLLLALIAASLGWWLFRPRISDEELILALVSRVEHGVETKSTKEIMQCIAPDYSDQAGLSRVDIYRLAWRWGTASETAQIVVDDYEVEVTSPTATGRFEVTVLFEQNGRQAPPVRLDLTVQFEKQRRRLRKVWLVKSSSGHGLEKGLENVL